MKTGREFFELVMKQNEKKAEVAATIELVQKMLPVLAETINALAEKVDAMETRVKRLEMSTGNVN